MGCLSLLHAAIFFFCASTYFCQYRFFFPGLFFCLVFYCLWRTVYFFTLFTLVIRDPADVRSPGHVCLALGASGYLGARQSRGPPGRGVAERAERVPAKLRVV